MKAVYSSREKKRVLRRVYLNNETVKSVANDEELGVSTIYQWKREFNVEDKAREKIYESITGSLKPEDAVDKVWKRSKDIIYSARNRKPQNFELDAIWLYNKVLNGSCEVTGINFNFNYNSSSRTNPYTPSVDRINSSGFYTKDNVQVVVWIYNSMKNDWEEEEIKKVAKSLIT